MDKLAIQRKYLRSKTARLIRANSRASTARRLKESAADSETSEQLRVLVEQQADLARLGSLAMKGGNLRFLLDEAAEMVARAFKITRKRALELLEAEQISHHRFTLEGPPLKLKNIQRGKAVSDFTTCIVHIVLAAIQRDALQKQAMEISEIEKRRMGQDLHDSLCQELFGIACLADCLRRNLAEKSMPETSAATDIASLLRDVSMRARTIARGLAPVETSLGDLTAFHELAKSVQECTGITCLFHASGTNISDLNIASQLFRITQEAVSNATKHSGAEQIAIRLTAVKDRLTLAVEDDGVGLPAEWKENCGMGFHNMRSRAEAIGGTLLVESGRDRGTVVTCSLTDPAFHSLQE